MLCSARSLLGYRLHETDGDLGVVEDFYFDDASWRIRYLVAGMGGWLHHRRVLISPASLGHPDTVARRFPVSLTKAQISSAPDVDTDRPVSRQQEVAMSAHFGWPAYWTHEPALVAEFESRVDPATAHVEGDPHLRSFCELIRYRVRAKDAVLGSVSDLLLEEDGWTVGGVIIDTAGGLRHHRVRIATGSVKAIRWKAMEVVVEHTRAELEQQPAGV
ncbi:MAG: PRC-barrel domain-containing protein [Bryobacteraceae bacterium]